MSVNQYEYLAPSDIEDSYNLVDPSDEMSGAAFDRRTALKRAGQLLTVTAGAMLLDGCAAQGPVSGGYDYGGTDDPYRLRTDSSAPRPEPSRTPEDIKNRHENATTVAITIASGIINRLERSHRGRHVLRDRRTGDVSAWTASAETDRETGKPKIKAEWRGSSSVFSGSYHTTLAEQKRRHDEEPPDGDKEQSLTISTSIRYNGARTDIPLDWTMSELLARRPDSIVVDEIQFQADRAFIDALNMPTDGTDIPTGGRLETDAKSPIDPVVDSRGVIVGWNKVVGDIVGNQYTDELYVLAEYVFGDVHSRPKDSDGPGGTGS